MTYTKQIWVDGQTGGTPLTASSLNHIENGIGDATDAAAAAQTTANAAIPSSQKGAASGVATLDSTGKVPSAQLSALPTSALMPSFFNISYSSSSAVSGSSAGQTTISDPGYPYYVVLVASQVSMSNASNALVPGVQVSVGGSTVLTYVYSGATLASPSGTIKQTTPEVVSARITGSTNIVATVTASNGQNVTLGGTIGYRIVPG